MDRLHAEMHQAMLNENLQRLSELLAKRSDAIAKGAMAPDHEAQCAPMSMQVSPMMVEMTSPADKNVYAKQRHEIEKMEKEWRYWEELEEH